MKCILWHIIQTDGAIGAYLNSVPDYELWIFYLVDHI